MKAAGGKMQEMSPAFVGEPEEAHREARGRLRAKMDKMGLNGKEVIRGFRAEVEKVSAEKKKPTRRATRGRGCTGVADETSLAARRSVPGRLAWAGWVPGPSPRRSCSR